MPTRSWSLLAAGLLVLASGASAAAQSTAPSSPEAVASAAPAASAPTGTFGAAWESVPCDTFDVNEKAAAMADCGYVTVPENRAAGTADTIQLAVVRLRSASAEPDEPVVIGTGGPGGSGLDFLSKENLARRGSTGRPSGVPCSPIATSCASHSAARSTPSRSCSAPSTTRSTSTPRSTAGPRSRSTPSSSAPSRPASTVSSRRAWTRTATICVENAADIVDIKDALGYDKIAYHGESYGTLLGQFLMRDHPEIPRRRHPRWHRTRTLSRYSQMLDIPAAFQRIYDACDAQETCKTQYGDLAATVQKLIEQTDATHPTVTVKGADGSDQSLALRGKNVLEFLLTQLYQGGKDFPQYATGMLADITKYAQEIAPSAGAPGFARMQHFAINCADDPNASMDEFGLETVPEYLQGFLYDDGVREVIACKLLDIPQLDATSDELVRSDLPTLLLNGGLDPATAAANGQVVAEGLPNSQYVLFPAGGHVQSGDPCAVSMIAAFLKDPSAPVDTSCIAPAGQLAALTPVTVKSGDGSAALTMSIMRPTWRDAGAGHVRPRRPGPDERQGPAAHDRAGCGHQGRAEAGRRRGRQPDRGR